MPTCPQTRCFSHFNAGNPKGRGEGSNGVSAATMRPAIPTITRDDAPAAAAATAPARDHLGVARQHSLQQPHPLPQQQQQQQPQQQKKSSFLDSFRPRSKSDATRSTRKPNLFAAHRRLVSMQVQPLLPQTRFNASAVGYRKLPPY